MYTNPANCAEFYKCSAGQSVLQRCPSQLYFDQPKQYCNYAHEVKCNRISAEPVSDLLMKNVSHTQNPLLRIAPPLTMETSSRIQMTAQRSTSALGAGQSWSNVTLDWTLIRQLTTVTGQICINVRKLLWDLKIL